MKYILIVEDDSITALDLKDLLKEFGSVEIARDGAEALEKIKQKAYDLIITDDHMPQMKGEEFHIRVLALNKDLAKRIVFASGQITDFIRSTGNPFLVKPFSHEQLIEAVKKPTP